MDKIKIDTEKTYRYYIVLGDWSNDGHNQFDKILIESNVKVEDLRAAYLRSINSHNITFNSGNMASGKISFCTGYDEYTLTESMFEALVKNECPINEMGIDGVGEEGITIENCEDCTLNEESFLNILMWFIGISVGDGFKWHRIKDEIPCFNGYWGPLNITLGYGLYQL